jgi:hypothetical protein
MVEETSVARASTARKDAENLIAESRGNVGPCMVIRHQHLAKDAEAEAEDQTPAQAPLSTSGIHETLGNA